MTLRRVISLELIVVVVKDEKGDLVANTYIILAR